MGNKTIDQGMYSTAIGVSTEACGLASVAAETVFPVHDLAKGNDIIYVSNGVTAQTAAFIKE